MQYEIPKPYEVTENGPMPRFDGKSRFHVITNGTMVSRISNERVSKVLGFMVS